MSLVLLGACSQQAAVPTQAPSLEVSALLTTADETAGALELHVEPDADGYSVTLSPGGAALGRELYVALDYDATALHAVELAAVASDTAIGLAVEPEPGRIEFGAVSTSGAALPADGALLTLRLAPGAARTVSAKMASNAVEYRPRYLELKVAGESWELRWDYTNPGDANQNSIVGLDDLTPLGANFNTLLEPGWDNPLRNVDCDRNGEVNISDISVLGYAYRNEIASYLVQASVDGLDNWSTVAELPLAEQPVVPGRALRMAHAFGDSFEEGVYYRVQPLTYAREPGVPSEALSQERRIVDTNTTQGDTKKIVVSVFDLPAPLRMLNSVRLVYPGAFTYVPNSFNVGSPGGGAYRPDGMWEGFATSLLTPPDNLYPDKLYVETELGGGFHQINFNVSVVESILENSPDSYGDLFNFELRNDAEGDERLLISWDDYDDTSGYKTTYFSDNDDQEYFFGSTLMINVF